MLKCQRQHSISVFFIDFYDTTLSTVLGMVVMVVLLVFSFQSHTPQNSLFDEYCDPIFRKRQCFFFILTELRDF